MVGGFGWISHVYMQEAALVGSIEEAALVGSIELSLSGIENL